VKDPKYKHYFTVVNGKFIWEENDMLEYKRQNLEGKRGYAIIEGEGNKITPNQYAYYFGGIIRKECMASDTFWGLTDKQIHQILFEELRSTTKGIKLPDGTLRLVTVSEDFSSYNKEKMRLYIEELIPHLQLNYNIHPKPAEQYKYNKFYINPETFS
jgi:hypothetical protein